MTRNYFCGAPFKALGGTPKSLRRIAVSILFMASLEASMGSFGARSADLLGPNFSIWLENDAVLNTDRHYTHGSRLAYLAGEMDAQQDSFAASIARRIPAVGLNTASVRWGAQLGQSLYTPSELHDPELQLKDRPYAAWLYGAIGLQRRGTTFGDVPTLDAFTLDLGLVGPGALGEELQDFVHRVDAVGWDHQLRNEPAIDFEGVRRWRFSTEEHASWTSQILPYAGVRLGTLQVEGKLGLQVRTGYRIPDDFGRHALEDAAPETGGRSALLPNGPYAYLLLGAEGKAVGWNMLLDGNLWHGSHSVEKEPAVADFNAGLVFGWRRIELAYIHVFRTLEFRGQPEVDSFGSVSVSYRW